MATPASADDVLFFIPDIGGFTKFVAENEIRHSQHIIKELLEILVDANTLGLTVSEIEGDAVLFYRKGPAPSLDQLVGQARRMYLDFHTHLKKFEFARICQCGACAGAGGIALKMVAHFGSAGSMQVKDRQGFIGKDIIIAHRLLKNSVTVPEYLLVTAATLSDAVKAGDDFASFDPGEDAYDNLGTIEYRVKALDGYRNEIRVEPPPPSGIEKPRGMARLSRVIDAPIEQVYQRLIDLPGRVDWIAGATRVEMSDERLNQIGKTHKCLRGEEGIELMTTEVKVGDATMELWETDLKKTIASRYVLTRLPGGKTDVAVELHVRDNLMIRAIFRILMEKKLRGFFEQSIANLASLCEKADR